MTGDFFFVPPVEEVTVNPTKPAPKPTPAKPTVDLAAQAWSIIEQSADPKVFQAFVVRFPDALKRSGGDLSSIQFKILLKI